jgi:hypothetical protein
MKSFFARQIAAGKHFGTALETDVESGPPIAIDQLSEPEDLVLLWVADTWLGNIDRANEGNILLQHAGGGKFHVIAADQSDCFGGTTEFISRHFPINFRKLGKANAPKILASAIWRAGGKKPILRAIEKAIDTVSTIPEILASVPEEWWHGASVDPGALEKALVARSEDLDSIIQPRMWEVPDDLLF